MSRLHTFPRSLYIHIPFCASKCFYCDFNSYVSKDPMREAYTEHLIGELRLLHDRYCEQGVRPPLDTIYFGGGTPTMLSVKQWRRITECIHALFTVSVDTEWTTEANPGTVDLAMLCDLKSFGVNRISFGVQTFNETLLQAIGRLHGAEDIIRSVNLAQEAGLARISLDLMLGLPDQTMEDIEEALRFVFAAGVSHVSAYGLKVEQNTPFAKWQKAGLLPLPEEETEVAMYETVRNALVARGFVQYEISNFALPGEEARHNLIYWRNLPYLAAGAGAHGYLFGERYENERSLKSYGDQVRAGALPAASRHAVEPQEAVEDTMILGLRLQGGVAFAHFESLHGISLFRPFGKTIERLTRQGLLELDHQRIWIPPRYYEVANEIFASFISVAE